MKSKHHFNQQHLTQYFLHVRNPATIPTQSNKRVTLSRDAKTKTTSSSTMDGDSSKKRKASTATKSPSNNNTAPQKKKKRKSPTKQTSSSPKTSKKTGKGNKGKPTAKLPATKAAAVGVTHETTKAKFEGALGSKVISDSVRTLQFSNKEEVVDEDKATEGEVAASKSYNDAAVGNEKQVLEPPQEGIGNEIVIKAVVDEDEATEGAPVKEPIKGALGSKVISDSVPRVPLFNENEVVDEDKATEGEVEVAASKSYNDAAVGNEKQVLEPSQEGIGNEIVMKAVVDEDEATEGAPVKEPIKDIAPVVKDSSHSSNATSKKPVADISELDSFLNDVKSAYQKCNDEHRKLFFSELRPIIQKYSQNKIDQCTGSSITENVSTGSRITKNVSISKGGKIKPWLDNLYDAIHGEGNDISCKCQCMSSLIVTYISDSVSSHFYSHN